MPPALMAWLLAFHARPVSASFFWTDCQHGLGFQFYTGQGVSQAGSQGGMRDERSALVKEGFRVYDSLDNGFAP